MNSVIFPFDKVKKGAIIAIYGAGEIGLFFIRQLAAVNYCAVGWLVDQKFEGEIQYGSLFKLPPSLMDWEKPEQIIIASMAYKNDIVDYLIQQGVPLNKLVIINPEQKIDMSDLFQAALHASPADNKWGAYYKAAENSAKSQFTRFIEPILDDLSSQLDFSSVLDFACGEGRMADQLKERCQHLELVDSSPQAIEHCAKRFAHIPYVITHCNNAGALPQHDSSVSLIYSWDAMVHFSYKSIDFYFNEFNRILKPHGHIIIHHSNLATLADSMHVFEQWNLNVDGRSNVSKEDIVFIANHYGLKVIRQVVIDWGVINMDCISVLTKK